MEIIIERKYKKENYTIGSLFIKKSPHMGGDSEGAVWFCNTLEPPVGTEKEMITSGSGKAIPPGIYKVRLVFSPKFQQYLPKLEDIPAPLPITGKGKSPEGEGLGAKGLGTRSGILVHAGNSIRDTRGCILVGKNTRPGKVLQSKEVLNNFINKIRKANGKREEVTIEIK